MLPRATKVGAKLAKGIRGQLRAMQAIRCISHVLLYDCSSHIREEINRTFSSGAVMESSFFLFYASMEITIGEFQSKESGYTQTLLAPWQTLSTNGYKGWCNHRY